MAKITIKEGFRPHPAQLEVYRAFNDPVIRYYILSCGRRWGKTLLATRFLVYHALKMEKGLSWWCSNIYSQVEWVFHYICTAFNAAIKKVDRSKLRITWITGHTTEFKSLDRFDNLRGRELTRLVVDEAASCQQQAWISVLKPMMISTKGKVFFVSTPRGRNWFFDLFLKGQSNLEEDKEYKSWKFASSTNTAIPGLEEEIEKDRLIMSAQTFAEEYLADFVVDEYGPFKHLEDCIIHIPSNDPFWLENRIDKGSYVLGVDIAKLKDWTVIVVIDVKRKTVIDFWRGTQVDYTAVAEVVKQKANKWNASSIVVDSTGVGEAFSDFLAVNRLPLVRYNLTHASKVNIINTLALGFAQKSILIPDTYDTMIQELKIYETQKRGDVITYNAPKDKHDDCVIALALAYWGMLYGQQSNIAFKTIKKKKTNRLLTGV